MSARADADRARAYDAWYETGLGAAAHQIELRLVAELAAPVSGERALDVGCGTGIYTAWLAAQGLDVAGLDREPSMLAAARGKVPGVHFVEGDATALPFADADFDLALATTLFCFLNTEQRQAAAPERLCRAAGEDPRTAGSWRYNDGPLLLQRRLSVFGSITDVKCFYAWRL